ncbi:MAG: SEC-C domain-containing protein [Actinomycetota bacterium]|nr:SEC-C domain-containing protein [Actinomycetota bacterium]
MAEITFEGSWREIERINRRAEEAERAGDVEGAVGLLRDVLAHPCAHHHVAAHEVLEEIHLLWRRAQRWDDAIAAKREAIAAGFRSVPDPEADIAECLVGAGRRREAYALFAELRLRDTEDVWLNNSAAFAFRGVDERESLRWALDGIELAFATGDPDGVAMQLLELAEASWEALGEPADASLVARVERFVEDWSPGRRDIDWGDSERDVLRPCAHCGFDPEWTRAEDEERARRARRRVLEQSAPEALARLDATFGGSEPRRCLSKQPQYGLAWFPAEQWAAALERWPELADDLPTDHREYSRRIESRMKYLAREMPGVPLRVSPLDVERLVEHAAEAGEDPGLGEGRSSMAAEVVRTGGALAWPPARNERCWCGSGTKYKRCCGPAAAADP